MLYQITGYGRTMARRTDAPAGSEVWRALYYMDRTTYATSEDLSAEGVSGGAVSKLIRDGLVIRIGGRG